MHVDRHELSGRAARRRAWLGMLSLLAVTLHAGFLSGLDWTWPRRETPHAQAVLVRTIEPVADEKSVPTNEMRPPAAVPPIAPAVPVAAVRRVVAAKPPRPEAAVLLAVAPKPRIEPGPSPLASVDADSNFGLANCLAPGFAAGFEDHCMNILASADRVDRRRHLLANVPNGRTCPGRRHLRP